uniref:Death-associated protein 1 n=1 Tax=Panagrolaimus sp. JU765 TaxID=591449 RepID=A0AC34QQQ2_9BILA
MTEESEVKINHAPAEKIGGVGGGMRIARKERHSSSEVEKPSNNADEEFPEETSNAVAQSVLVQQRQKDYPTEGVRVFHDKPQPTREPPPASESRNKHGHDLFQPRRH